MASSSPSELSLDCKPHGSYSLLLKSFGDQHTNDQTQKLEHVLSRLEEERTKIDAFKRQLPLCMQLLTNAVEASRQQLNEYRENQGSKLVLEEFLPLKNSEKPHMSDKANWMTSAQLWSQAGNETKPQPGISSSAESDMCFNVRNGGGAFLPFSKDRNSLAHDHKKSSKAENGEETGDTTDGQRANTNSGSTVTNSSQPQRKARRCWSPDLHRRFVNALQMLGGSQVATPKQIRELMKVEGLTNDEVKSHLQKYRLHTRRPSTPSPQPAGPATPQLVVLGGIWVPPEYATAASVTHGGAPALYEAHHHHPVAPHAPPHFCASPVPQEFYTAAAAGAVTPGPASQLLHHQLHVYKAASQAHSSPESESNEDDKSESSSWKGESGDNCSGGR
ncbi:hypothetical protein V6N13_095243 [Hibiscus sabdariffa]|uniref:HTH myb-type domain-containing protein n=1 Tax=Hibiscus sabdariffa TaxID=183260 RepID=A0ABR2PSC2_9ROSI